MIPGTIVAQQSAFEKKLRNEERERQLLSKFLQQEQEQLTIVERVPLIMIDDDSCRKKIYKYMIDMFYENKKVNFYSLKDRITLKPDRFDNTDEMLEELEDILQTPCFDSVDNIAETLDIHYKNRIIYHDIVNRAEKGLRADVDPRDLLDDIAKSLASAEPVVNKRSFAQMAEEYLQMITNPTESQKGLKTGLNLLDSTYGGVIKDRYWTIGAESGNGKTAFIVNLLVRLCTYHADKVSIIFYSMEMSEERIIERIISCILGMSSFKLNGREEPLTDLEIHKIKEAIMLIKEWPITLIYKSQSISSLRQSFRKFALENQNKHLIGMVDHIGKIEGGMDRRVLTIEASQACKSFCIDYKATMFVLSQLRKEISDPNNRINQETFHRPNQSHIMESGAIKADSDNMLLLWRPEFRFEYIDYQGCNFATKNKMIVINEKNRDGNAPTDMVFKCEIKYSRFDNLTNPFEREEQQSFNLNDVDEDNLPF